jgi:ribonuclease HII
MILGIDEVGRGPWAGPLVVGAVVLGGADISGLTDSKKLSKKQREKLDIEIREKASGIGLGWVEAGEIDEIGLSQALKLATRRAVEQINVTYHEIIIDGTINFLAETSKGKYVTTLKKADLLIPSVSAASIIAKVARDNYMVVQDELYPGYGFKNHVGYGTAAHQAAINNLGVTVLHRLSFAPLKKYAGQKKVVEIKPEKITTKNIGDEAEDMAVKYLKNIGHVIVDRNWKIKYCEIDIVSQTNDIIYFTEVKYRKKPDQGGGLAAITAKKLNQMKFAAEFYINTNKLTNLGVRLVVISLAGPEFMIENYIEV